MTVSYVIALAFHMEASTGEVSRRLLEGPRRLSWPGGEIRVTGESGLGRAPGRLGAAAPRRRYETVATPQAVAETTGARYRGWRLVSLDGGTLDLADTEADAAAFGRPGAGRRAGRAPPPAPGDRDRHRRARELSARPPHRPALQDAGAAPRGVSRPVAGPPRQPRPDARGRAPKAARDPDEPSFIPALGVVERGIPLSPAMPPSAP